MDAKTQQDAAVMRQCLDLAAAAAARGEVPVAAAVVAGGRVLAAAANRCVALRSPLAHAEMLALAAAFAARGEARLPDAEVFCTLEPCFMCTGALLHARVARLVFAAHDPKFGACGSLADLPADRRLNHRFPVESGLMAAESAALLRDFFQERR